MLINTNEHVGLLFKLLLYQPTLWVPLRVVALPTNNSGGGLFKLLPLPISNSSCSSSQVKSSQVKLFLFNLFSVTQSPFVFIFSFSSPLWLCPWVWTFRKISDTQLLLWLSSRKKGHWLDFFLTRRVWHEIVQSINAQMVTLDSRSKNNRNFVISCLKDLNAYWTFYCALKWYHTSF